MATAAIVGGTVLAGVIQARGASSSASSAARAQREAAEAAQRVQEQRFTQVRADLSPFMQQGQQAFQLQGALSGAAGPEAQAAAFANYVESPGVQFQREQGMRSLENNLASGGRGGGTRIEAISRFNQGLALQDFNNQFNRLGQGAAIGAGAAGQLAQGGINMAAQEGQNRMAVGAAQAGGIIGQANARNQGIGNIAGAIGAFAGGGGFSSSPGAAPTPAPAPTLTAV